jgi:hypothetical protein
MCTLLPGREHMSHPTLQPTGAAYTGLECASKSQSPAGRGQVDGEVGKGAGQATGPDGRPSSQPGAR